MLEAKADRHGQDWDPFVRLGHWALAAFFALAYWLGGDWLALHAHAGYTLALLVVFRFIWGFIGPQHARFADFVVGPAGQWRYLRALPWRRQPYSGHDPLGGWMIVMLLGVLGITAATGMILFAMENRGPLAGTVVVQWPAALVEQIHHLAADACLVLVVTHVAGVIFMSFWQRRNLVGAMIRTAGEKRASGDA